MLALGVIFEAHEAVAVAQQLILAPSGEAPVPPFGPPTADNVEIRDDGSVASPHGDATPAVSEIGALLDAMLPHEAFTRVPGGLRYAIARARNEVDAPPFDSLAALSAALQRYERGDQREVLRALVSRKSRVVSQSRVAGRESSIAKSRAVVESRGGVESRASVESPAGVESPASVESRAGVESPGVVESRAVVASPQVIQSRQVVASREVDARSLEVDATSRHFMPGDVDSRAPGHERRVARRDRRGDRRVARPAVPTVPTVPAVPAVPLPDLFVQRDAFSPPVRRHSGGSWLLAGAVAAAMCFSATYVGVLHYRLAHQLPRGTTPPSAAVSTLPDRSPTGVSAAQEAAAAFESLGRSEQRDPQRATRTTGSNPSVVPAAPPEDGQMFSPAFASNGTAIFYHTGRSTDARSALAEKPLDNDLQVMTILDDGWKNYHVQPSPDGARIAFDSDRDGERGVYVAGRDGSDVHRVSGPGYAAVPTWSPDGQQLAFVRGEPNRPRVWNLWLTTLSSGQMRRLTGFRSGQTWGASWFADGERVAYTHEDELAILHLASGATRTFKSPIKGRLVRTAAVSPDGRHVIFQVSGNGAWVVDLADGSMQCVLTDPTAEEFAWSPDGRRVAFHSRRDGQWGIWIMASDQS